MKIKHLDHINMTVRDFDQTVDWYGRVFDFVLVEEAVTEGIRWGVIRSGEALLCIYEDPSRKHLDRFELRVHGAAPGIRVGGLVAHGVSDRIRRGAVKPEAGP